MSQVNHEGPYASWFTKGFTCKSFYVKNVLSPREDFLLTGSSNNDAYLWDISTDSNRVYRLIGHDGEVTSVAWSHAFPDLIATCSDDSTIRFWTLMNESKRSKYAQIEPCVAIRSEGIKKRKIGSISMMPCSGSPLSASSYSAKKINHFFTPSKRSMDCNDKENMDRSHQSLSHK
jgi:WD40 repeat protein